MTPYLNENFDQMQTKSDMVLVSMWPYAASWPWQKQKQRRLERGMVVTFRYEPSIPTTDQRLMRCFLQVAGQF
jgi:hypothetical protein